MKALVMIRRLPGYRYEAFETGLKRLGYVMVNANRYGKEWPDSRDDLLVTWNLHQGYDEKYARDWERRGGTVLVCENGYLQQVDKTRYAISTHGHNGSGWFPQGTDLRFPELRFELKPWQNNAHRGFDDGHVLVRDQRSIGSALMASPRGWGPRMVASIKTQTRRPVRLMPHPGDKGKLEADLAQMRGAESVVIWSSAIGVRALVEGIDVACHAPHWICATAAAHKWAHAGETTYRAEREAALEHMAHGQWHHEEIADGEPFARMKAENWGPTWD